MDKFKQESTYERKIFFFLAHSLGESFYHDMEAVAPGQEGMMTVAGSGMVIDHITSAVKKQRVNRK